MATTNKPMKQLPQKLVYLQTTGGMMMVAGLVGHLFFPSEAVPVFYLTGTLCYTCIQMLQSYEGRSFVVRRLRRIQILSDIALILSGFALLLPYVNLYYGHRNEWLICLAIGAVLQLYTAFRIPAELQKEQ